ncbi:hypothetical protein IKQ21_04395 [bacterium]|nr:hypothetical protein [bacterium]
MIFATQGFAQDLASNSSTTIEDEIIKSGFISKNKHKIKRHEIKDELLDPTMYKGAPFRLGVFKNRFKTPQISDELIDSEFIGHARGKKISRKAAEDDFFFEKQIDTSRVRRIKAKTKYDFTKKQIPVKIRIANRMDSTKGTMEGNDIPFVAEEDFEIEGKKFEKGTTILGRVETISNSDKMGVPECIKLDNFYIEGNEEINLHGSISKTGANRTIWVYPLYQAGNICFYVAGFVFVPIHGGRAKLLTSETFTVFYETQ